ncbi:AfsR/SARP family transcriptional regulator [Streptomyces sp. 769]|uniref:AfsR/SARP family transcriptional regulator n=1 Tax=Streptomyces sp. 769 TaxID=1262452 RepID=UPI000581F476|nr:AfsR/SARP family transcriptional regulator [Streptomyces sp. 769]AJC62156.1 SARP family transcriptional regulator [Streptomyces sp. 769]
MDIFVLGPMEILAAGVPITPTARKPRQLLSLLLFHIGQKVSNEKLIRGVWDDDPPQTAHATLQTYIVQLRRRLKNPVGSESATAKDILTTVDDGYMFVLPDGRFDLMEYRRLSRQGSAALKNGDLTQASQLLHDALSCWRGEALSNVRLSGLLQSEVQRLSESRVRTIEYCIDADLRLGGHREVLEDLSRLCAENPLYENLQLEYMVALYRSGLRVEAMNVFHQVRSEMVEHLGLEPSAALRRLNESILRADDSLDHVFPETYLGVDPQILGSVSAEKGVSL